MIVARSFIRALAVCLVIGLALYAARSYGAGCPGSGQQSTGPDVICGGVGVSDSGTNDIANFASATINGVSYETFSMATVSCNLGNQPLPWFTPGDSSGPTSHPVIDQNFFRLKSVNGSRRFEQLAQGWVKYGFCAFHENVCCTTCIQFGDAPCGNHTYLGVGCSDPYTGARNGGQTTSSYRCPKYAINATAGTNVWPIPNPAGSNSSVWRRMHINVADLEVSNGTGDVNATRYFGECMYLHADDASNGNKNNNASYRAIATSLSGSNWSFNATVTTSNTTVKQRSGIRAWMDTDTTATIPGTITRVVETDIITPEDNALTALVILGAQATNLGNGSWHYEYALQNLNSDRSIASFSIPVPASATVTNIGFRDVDYWDGDGVNATGVGGTTYDGTDWPGVFSGGAVSWACTQTFAVNQGANALRWGSMYNFRFDCNLAPQMSGNDVALVNATMAQFKPNGINITGPTIVPTLCVSPVVDPIHSAAATCGVNFVSGSPSLSSGTAPVVWSLGAGAPAGMTMNSSTGAVTWPAPLTGGSPYTITTQATNDCGSGSQNWSLTVNPNPPAIDPISNAFAVCGTSYASPAPTTSGGAAPLSWTLLTGPAGMTIDASTGAVTWPSPVATGSPFVISVQADSANSCGTSSPQNWQLGVVIGDFDADGLVTDADIDGFVNSLLLDTSICAGDLNGDGFVDGNDIAAFDAALGL